MPSEETNLQWALIHHSWPLDPSETWANTSTKAAQAAKFVMLTENFYVHVDMEIQQKHPAS